MVFHLSSLLDRVCNLEILFMACIYVRRIKLFYFLLDILLIQSVLFLWHPGNISTWILLCRIGIIVRTVFALAGGTKFQLVTPIHDMTSGVIIRDNFATRCVALPAKIWSFLPDQMISWFQPKMILCNSGKINQIFPD